MALFWLSIANLKLAGMPDWFCNC